MAEILFSSDVRLCVCLPVRSALVSKTSIGVKRQLQNG